VTIRAPSYLAVVALALLATLVAFASTSALAASPPMANALNSTHAVAATRQAAVALDDFTLTPTAVAKKIAIQPDTKAEQGDNVAIQVPKTTERTTAVQCVRKDAAQKDIVGDNYVQMTAGQQFRRTIVVDTLATADITGTRTLADTVAPTLSPTGGRQVHRGLVATSPATGGVGTPKCC
jgi:hypothetical protein